MLSSTVQCSVEILVQDIPYWRGIHGTQVEPSIQDIVDEVAPIKEAPLWG